MSVSFSAKDILSVRQCKERINVLVEQRNNLDGIEIFHERDSSILHRVVDKTLVSYLEGTQEVRLDLRRIDWIKEVLGFVESESFLNVKVSSSDSIEMLLISSKDRLDIVIGSSFNRSLKAASCKEAFSLFLLFFLLSLALLFVSNLSRVEKLEVIEILLINKQEHSVLF